VKKLALSATLLASLLLVVSLTPNISGQQQSSYSANVQKYKIAVVDISAVFKHYQPFTGQVEAIKKEVVATEATLKQERASILQMQEQLRGFNPGTEPFKKLDEEIASAQANFKLKADRLRKDFMDKEARVYHQAYLQIEKTIKLFAQHNDLGLVLRFSADEIDPSKPVMRTGVLRHINKPVIYQNGIDITQDIIVQLNQGGGQTARKPNTAAPAPRR
jgi:Skp family chaperone for outer membrane proteins